MSSTHLPNPVFLVEESALIQNLELLKKVQDKAQIDILLSLKAFALWPLFPLIKKYIAGASASSLHEARLIHEEMGCPAHTYSPAFSVKEIKQIADYSSHIIFNSVQQFEQFHPQLEGKKTGLRVNPMVSVVETDLYNPASPDSRLGITKEQLGTQLPAGVSGLHFHALCESSATDFEKVLLGFEEQFGEFLPSLQWVNFGGGHLITHKDYDVNHFISIIRNFKQKYKLEVFIEPGSAIAWDTGNLITEVIDIVENGGIKTAILNISFTAHLPDTLEMPYRPKVLEASPSMHANGFTYHLGGNSCLSGDYLSNYSFDRPLHIGDTLTFKDMIHYTTVKTSFFNGVKHPAIYMKKQDGSFQKLKSFSFHDYKNRMC